MSKAASSSITASPCHETLTDDNHGSATEKRERKVMGM